MSSNHFRFVIAVVLILATAAFLEARGGLENIPKSKPLSLLPSELNGWRSVDRPISDEVRAVLGPGEFLDRLYIPPTNGVPIELFIGYFPSQRTGNTIHSPQNCLPGAGWNFMSFRRTPLGLPGMKNLQVNETVIGKGASRMFIIYWYQAHGRGVASEYWARFYLAADAIRMNRTDGAIVRFTTSILPDETPEAARGRLLELASQLSPRLRDHIPD